MHLKQAAARSSSDRLSGGLAESERVSWRLSRAVYTAVTSSSDLPPKSVSLKQLSAAAALVAEKLQLQLKKPQPMDLLEDAPIRGYLRLLWFLQTPDGQPWGQLALYCEGGYGAGREKGPGWFKSWVSITRTGESLPALSQSLVSQWEYPHDARAPAKHTRLRFVKWAQDLPANPLASSERKPGPRP